MSLRWFSCVGTGWRCVYFWTALLPAAALTAQEPSPSPPAAPALPPVIARYEQMLATSPTKGTAFDKVYQYYFEGEGVDALDARWRARAANSPAFLLLDGLLAERRSRPADARTLYQQYTAAHPDDPRGWTALGELETAEGRFRPSADALAHALAPEARPPVPASLRPTLYRELARAQTRDFLGAAALATWRKLAAEFPEDPSVLQEVGEAFQEGESYDEARATFEKLRELARKNGDAFGRINATLRLGQIEEARGHAREAVAVYEGVVADAKTGSWLEREARARIEQLYRGQEDLPGLAEYYKKWLDDHPKDIEVATRRAAVLVELNHKDQAIDLLREAVAWAPDRQELQVELAHRLAETNRPAEAIAVMERLTAVAPEEKSYWQLLGDARWQAFDLGPAAATMGSEEKARLKAAALDAWGHLSLPDSKDAVATGQLADLLASHRLADEALAQYARAAALAPDLPDTRERWAAYLAQINRRDEARRVLAGIVTADPKNATAANYARLATALDRLDDADGALDATAKGLALEPRNFDLLALRWQELAAAKKWDDTLALYPALLAAAPNAYFTEQVQTRQVAALQGAGKLADTRAALAARLDAAPPATPLDENELALLVRADFQSGDDEGKSTDEVRRALAEGRARFPRNASLLRLEGEAARRAHDPEAQVAVLRRLLELQPQQKTDVLQEITHVWRDAGRTDEALAAARELVAASPANAASYLLEADLLLGGDHAEDGLARLREAIRLSEKPNEVRLRLARAEGDLGHVTQARQTLDEAFEAAGDARERLALMKALADAYQRENRLDELIARFQHLQQAEADGWRYALYLAEIYQQTLDYGGARRELAKALAARPRDGALLRQLVRLSTEEQNSAEVARYQSLLTEAEPSDTNKLALIGALLENNQTAEGFNALRTHLSAVLKIPGAWNQLLPLLAQHDLIEKAGELLNHEMGGPDADVKSRFTLALFQTIAGNLDQARTAFWSVFAAKSPRASAPPAPPKIPKGLTASYAMSLYYGGGVAQRRYQDAMQTQYMAQNFLTDGGKGIARMRNYYSGSSGTAQAGGPSPTDTARDAALLYLAAIAVKENAAAPFLAELDRRLDARDSSREDRLVAYATVDAVEPFLQQAAAQVRTPDADLDVFCLSFLCRLASMNEPSQRQYYPGRSELTAAQTVQMESLFEALLPRAVRSLPPAPGATLDATRYSFLKGLGHKDQAEALRRKALAGVDEKTDPGQLESALGLLMDGPMSAPERVQLKTVCRALAAAAARPAAGQNIGQSFYYYPLMPWQQDSAMGKLPPAEIAEIEADLLSLWYPATPPPPSSTALGNSNPQGYRYQNGSPRDEGYLPPTRFLDMQHVRILQQLLQYKPGESEWLTLLGAQLDRQAQELPAPVRIYPRLVATYLAAASGDKARALTLSQALLAEQPDDNDLRLLTGLLLGRNDKPAEAVALLSAITNARYGETALTVQQLILLNAKAAKDTDNARRAALRLVGLRLSPEERTQLATDLRELGVNDKADQVARAAVPAGRGSSGRGSSIFDYQTANQLDTLVKAKNNDAALSLIRSVFAAMPPPAGNNNNGEYVIDRATSALGQLGKTDTLIADAEKQLARDPDSLSLNYQLAVLGGGSWTKEKRPAKHAAPLWVKLTRAGETVTGWSSADGEHWEEIDHAAVPLGSAPLAALAAATSQKPPKTPSVVIDHVALTPAPSPDPAGGSGGALPAPWKETLLPTDQEKENTVPPSIWQDGVFTLHATGWNLWGRYDDTRLIYRPLGEATEFVAHVASVAGADEETKTGVMWRADLSADSPYAAVIVLSGGGLSFQHRDHANRATAYWRKVVALQPKEARYGRALAVNLAGRGQHEEARAIFDALIAANPDESFGSTSDLREVYGDERLPELADRLLAWAPASTNNLRNNPGATFDLVATACAAKHQPEKVVTLCRRGIELDNNVGYSTNVELFERLLQTLLEQKHEDEAREALLSCYVPPADGGQPFAAGGASATPQLGFRTAAASRSQNAGRWMWNTTWNYNDLGLANLAPLEIGNKAGLLEGLQAALEKRRAADADRFATDGLDWLLTLVQLDRRDPAVLEGLPALLAKAANTGNYRGNEEALVAVRMEIARRLRQWPEHEALALEAYRAARKLAAGVARQQQGGYYADLPATVSLQQAATELSLEDLPGATATLREVAGGLYSSPGAATRNRSAETARLCLNLLGRAGPEADAAYVDLYNRATATEQGKKDFYFAYGLEKNQRAGDNPHFQAMAWLLDDGGTGDDATVVYELRALHPYDKNGRGRYPGSRGRSFPGSEGERTLTFSYGPDPDHFAPVGQLKTAATFGTWKGPLPRGSGALKVTVDVPRSADAEALTAEEARQAAQAAQATPTPTESPAPAAGPAPTPAPLPTDYWLPVVRTANLMSNPGFEGLSNRDPAAAVFALAGWTGLPGGSWKYGTFESPLPGRPYVRCDLAHRDESTVTGTRIPWEAGHAYFQSAWLRDLGDGGSVHFGRRYLDADGTVLKTSECPDFSTLIWRWHSQRLQPSGDDKDADTIPPKTAFIEPFIRVKGAVDWTGLFVGKAD